MAVGIFLKIILQKTKSNTEMNKNNKKETETSKATLTLNWIQNKN